MVIRDWAGKAVMNSFNPHSTVGRWVEAVNNNLLPGVQATLPLTAPMDWTEVYLDPEIYAGYGWLFPKKEVANIGIGLRTKPRNPIKTRAVLERFISRLRASGRVTGQAVGYTTGWIPAEPIRQAVYGNVLLVGDAAGHTHPITGAGIANAVICGEIAGKWAARSVEMDDPGVLHHYNDQWLDLLQETLDHGHQRRQTMESC
jgi:digeranylgeranylglycerophospholipid reductase